MSYTSQFPVTDPVILANGTNLPPQEIKIDSQYGSIEMFTPLGMFVWLSVARPARAFKNADGSDAAPKFKAALMFHPDGTADIEEAMMMLANANFDPVPRYQYLPNGQPNYTVAPEIVPPGDVLFDRGSGIDLCLLDGLDYWASRTLDAQPNYEFIRGYRLLNMTQHAAFPDGAARSVIVLDENGTLAPPTILYDGCYGRAKIRLRAMPQRGKGGAAMGMKRQIRAEMLSLQFLHPGHQRKTAGGQRAQKEAQALKPQITRVALPPAPGQQPMTPPPGQQYGRPPMPNGQPAPQYQQPPQQPQGQPNWGPPNPYQQQNGQGPVGAPQPGQGAWAPPPPPGYR